MKDVAQKKVKVMEQERLTVKKEVETIRGQKPSLEKEADLERKAGVAAKAQAVEVRAELEDMKMALDDAADATIWRLSFPGESLLEQLRPSARHSRSSSLFHRDAACGSFSSADLDADAPVVVAVTTSSSPR